ncbi:hypothetical protein XELAEV_18008216mg [Xenopus laevis]|uniref:Uncharacterized protein n=1 Tax=Xenopus laevis TaxID=8355 RepID=A0A974I630_XENLA|nr:hypothetical protein XELAEV_18008216mg [Xenopus laevis]
MTEIIGTSPIQATRLEQGHILAAHEGVSNELKGEKSDKKQAEGQTPKNKGRQRSVLLNQLYLVEVEAFASVTLRRGICGVTMVLMPASYTWRFSY